MDTAVRRNVAAGLAMVGAGVIAVSPIAQPEPTAIRAAKLEARLVNSIANVPINAFYALANVPYNETKALNEMSSSLFYTGNWWTPSTTNVWGEDPADPGHFESVINALAPFPAFSNVAGQQVAMIAAAELPADDSCGVSTCAPVIPADPITGIAGVDRNIQFTRVFAEMAMGHSSLDLLNKWFKVPFQDMNAGYTFPTDVPAADGQVVPSQSFTDNMGNTWSYEGTKPGPDGQQVMPWAGDTFTWDPMAPWKSQWESLTADPDTTGIAGTGIHLPTPEQTLFAYQSLLAGAVVDFNPFVAGSPVCPGQCDPDQTLGITTRSLVEAINGMYKGTDGKTDNAMIGQWLDMDANGTANGPTEEQTQNNIRLLQTGQFAFDPETTAAINERLASVNPVLPDIARNIGLLQNWEPDPDNPGEMRQYGGYKPKELQQNLNDLFGIPNSTEPTAPSTTSETGPQNAIAQSLSALQRLTTNQQDTTQDSVTSVPSPATKSVTMDVKSVSDSTESPAPKKATATVQQDDQDGEAFTRAATERLSKAFTGSNTTESTAGQSSDSTSKTKPTTAPSTGTTTDDVAVPGQSGGTGTTSGGTSTSPGGALGGALKTAGDQVSSGISKVTDGLTGGASADSKTDTHSTGGADTAGSGSTAGSSSNSSGSSSSGSSGSNSSGSGSTGGSSSSSSGKGSSTSGSGSSSSGSSSTGASSSSGSNSSGSSSGGSSSSSGGSNSSSSNSSSGSSSSSSSGSKSGSSSSGKSSSSSGKSGGAGSGGSSSGGGKHRSK